MKFLKGLFLVIGATVLAVGGYFLFDAWLEVRNIWAIANSMRSTTSTNPVPTVLIAAGVAAAGGLLLGIGIGFPTRSQGAVRKQALQDASDMREAAIRQRVGGDEPPVKAADEQKSIDTGGATRADKEQN
ncbi:MAG: hypothetical protein Q4F67_07035 [Propionibacteriaceae bacterium]|nr:hypothetical protein [Propionibacteriaceae bacterium]